MTFYQMPQDLGALSVSSMSRRLSEIRDNVMAAYLAVGEVGCKLLWKGHSLWS